MSRTSDAHLAQHIRIMEKCKGVCRICGKEFCEIALEESYSGLTLGYGYHTATDDNPAEHNAVKILEM